MIMYEKRIQLTLDKKSLAYLKRLVDSGNCASLSHANKPNLFSICSNNTIPPNGIDEFLVIRECDATHPIPLGN